MFMGAMMLIVLPLFLVVSARTVAKGDLGKRATGKLLEIFLYFSAAFCVAGLFLLIHQMMK